MDVVFVPVVEGASSTAFTTVSLLVEV